MNKQFYIYIMSNNNNTVLYTGVTNNLRRRAYEHKEGLTKFTKKYNVNKLVYFEIFNNINNAITREKQIKSGSRKKKIELINNMNIAWEDLYKNL